MTDELQREAESLFADVFFTLVTRNSEIQTFRRLVELGLPRVEELTQSRNSAYARTVFTSSEFDKYFLDKAAISSTIGGPEGLSRLLTSGELSVLSTSVDAASLVFMHSTLDAAVSDLCRVCFLVAPIEWERFVSRQTASLADVRERSVDDIVRARILQHLEALDREAVVRRIDRIFELCKPTVTTRPNYNYSRLRIEEIDKERQDVVHGLAVISPGVEDRIEYLLQTGLLLLSMVNDRYDVRIDPERDVLRHRGWSRMSVPGQTGH